MTVLAQYNIVPIVIAVVVALVVAFWIFRGGRKAIDQSRDQAPPAVRGRRADGPEGNTVPDEMAAAACDVAGQMLGVDAHPVIPGPAGPPDNLQTMKGVGPKLAAQLNECGITRFDQLAGLGANEVVMIDDRMGAFRGRIHRDRLVEQAAYLARGDTDGFEATFGRLGGSA